MVSHIYRKVTHEMHTIAKPFKTRRCACCKKLKRKTLHLDHCHSTNRLRGWLCMSCNVALGHIGDSVDTLRNMIAYLQSPSFYNFEKEKETLIENSKNNGGVIFSI